MEPQIEPSENPFAASLEKASALSRALSSSEACGLAHGDVERLLEAEGRELLRQFLQDHLDLRTVREGTLVAVGEGDGARTHRRIHIRKLESVFGTVEIERAGYGKPGCDSLHPLDAELNLPKEKYSHGVRRRMAEEVAKASFDTAIEAVEMTSGAHVPKRQAEELVRRSAQDFDDFYQTQAETPSDASASILAISLDGKGVVLRKEDLRKETRREAEKRRHKLKHRLSRGEKRFAKRMATVASVYTIAPHERTSEDVADGTKRGPAPKPVDKRVWASIEKTVEQVVGEAFEEARRQDPGGQKTWVGLVDGNKTQIRLLTAKALQLGVTLTIVLDLIHVLEYLWKAAYVFHKEGTPQAEAWVNKRLLALLRGESSLVAAGIRRSATKRGLAAETRAPADACANYLLTYKKYLRYDEYLKAGLPVATGVIEGACRHLIKDRMDVTGARWSLAGAEAVLKLRSLKSSGDFDAYWRFHEQQELQRNHAVLLSAPIEVDWERASRGRTPRSA